MMSIAAMVLAAGQGRRAEGRNKLTATIGGVPVVRRVVEGVLAAGVPMVQVVVGANGEATGSALAPVLQQFPAVSLVAVPANRPACLSLSLKTGLAAVERAAENSAGGIDGVLVCLGDMPLVQPGTLRRLIAVFGSATGLARRGAVCVPVYHNRRGNPVLWGAAHFAALRTLEGDCGGRQLLAAAAFPVCEVGVADPGVLIDLDTPGDLIRYGDAQK